MSASFWGVFEGQLRHAKDVPVWRLLLLFCLFGGCTATILHGFTYPKILCAPIKEERKRENGDIAWCRSTIFTSLGDRNHDVRVKHLVTQPGNAPKARPSHLTTADAVNKVSLKDSPSKTTKAESFRGCRPWTETEDDRGQIEEQPSEGVQMTGLQKKISDKIILNCPAGGGEVEQNAGDGRQEVQWMDHSSVRNQQTQWNIQQKIGLKHKLS